ALLLAGYAEQEGVRVDRRHVALLLAPVVARVDQTAAIAAHRSLWLEHVVVVGTAPVMRQAFHARAVEAHAQDLVAVAHCRAGRRQRGIVAGVGADDEPVTLL